MRERGVGAAVRVSMASPGVGSLAEASDNLSGEKRRVAGMFLAIKTCGYLVSTLSVVLLGVVSWKSASESPLLVLCLIAGMGASVCGMFLRWLTYDIEERAKAAGRE
jgi:hypothetical protein